MFKKLCISLIFSNLVATKLLSSNHRMHNLYTKFVKILEICKQSSNKFVNEKGNTVAYKKKCIVGLVSSQMITPHDLLATLKNTRRFETIILNTSQKRGFLRSIPL